ncbi:MAG: UDP-N-acetylmuramoyl-L-alanine--D-glutamate ligase [Chitinophagaceae bacterium]|nr:UDP-N-acetylmuramoyl-L-alanine--D-glutamate ligase [Chitinophagaceae bacterium]
MPERIVIIGGGESGTGAALLASQKGFEVFLSDAGSLKEEYRNELSHHGIAFEEGGHSLDNILNADYVVKSPGISDKTEIIKAIREKGIRIIGEVEFAFHFKGKGRIVAITGTNGKSTTTVLTYHLFRNAGLDCAACGNIGYSFARQVVFKPCDVYVLEISSFQLDDIVDFRPEIAILTNITEDHLDRYDYQFEKYIRSKFRIVMNQKENDAFIYNADDEVITKAMNQPGFIGYDIKSTLFPISMKKEIPMGAFIKDGDMYLRTGNEFTRMSIFDFALKGKHNYYNTMAACVASSLMEIRNEKIREALRSFEALEHRMEPVATIRGVEFINDSKSTNVNSTWYALESMTKPVILILGGLDKGNDYSLLTDLVKEKVKAIVCLGKDNRRIHEAFQSIVPVIIDTDSAEKAVHAAYRLAEKGDVVLLSPACASFDLFKNYEDRGKQFKKAVKEL